MAKVKKVVEDTRIGSVISKVNHPLDLVYKGKKVRVSPRQVLRNIKFTDLGELQKGLRFVSAK